MTLAEAGEIFGYWVDNPPAYLLLQAIARLLGWSPAAAASSAEVKASPVEDLAAAAPPGLTVVRGNASDTPAPFLDPEMLRERNRAHALALARRNASRV